MDDQACRDVACNVFGIRSIQLGDALTSEPLRVFPNPSSSTQGFELDVLKPNVNDGYQVKLMSMDGRLIYSNIFTKAKVVIKDIPPSAYLLEVVFNDGCKAVKKVIIN
ncbi:MAG: T9SS type A sorting domain-containing protein [Sphingobacteriia bacterium]|nr:T9SS type A sorting domain-containing protein [Sphingobacteriia bacterium]